VALALSENKRVGTLTHRQRTMLSGALSAKSSGREALLSRPEAVLA
jgi:hypothetical protein